MESHMNRISRVGPVAALMLLTTVAYAEPEGELKQGPPKRDEAGLIISRSGGSRTIRKPDFPPYKKVVEGTKMLSGFFNIHFNAKKQAGYLEIPAARLKKPFLLATSLAGGSSYTGWQWSDSLVYWTRHKKQLLLVEKNVKFRAKAGTPIGTSVKRTYTDQLILSIPIATRSMKGGYLISLNDLTARRAKTFFGSVGAMLDSSLVTYGKLKPFPHNVEVGLTMPQRGGGSFITLHYSMRELPRNRFKPREADDRIGYFLSVAKDFSAGSYRDGRFKRFINHWDLQRLDPKLKLSPVKDPIVFYIEKTVPVPYRRYVKEGIEEWNKAFRKCGFLNAITARQQTASNEFKDLDPEDARYNFFRWITSESAFAMGPSRVNPLTGQILDADIIFDDSMVNSSLVDYDHYLRRLPTPKPKPVKGHRFLGDLADMPGFEMLQPDARGEATSAFEKTVLQEILKRQGGQAHKVCFFGVEKRRELMLASLASRTVGGKLPLKFIGQVIKETVMHEVGHTLGLRHNYIASTFLPLAKINSKERPEAITASVMDYNPLNVTTDLKLQGNHQTHTLGPYDYWAIQYGYSGAGDAKALAAIASKCAKEGFAFATDEDLRGPDPYVNVWDLGADPLNFARKRVVLAKGLLKDLESRVVKPGEGYQRLRSAFSTVIYEYLRSAKIAARFIGGVRINRHHRGDAGARDPIAPIPAAKQREALKFILDEIFTTKNFDFSPSLLRKLGLNQWRHWGMRRSAVAGYPIHDRVLTVQKAALNHLFSSGTFTRLIDGDVVTADAKEGFTLPELFESCSKSILAELQLDRWKGTETWTPRKPCIASYRRNLQRAYVDELIELSLETGSGSPQIARTLAWHELRSLKARFESFAKTYNARLDRYTLAHCEQTAMRIGKALEAAYQLGDSGGSGGGFFLSFGKNGKPRLVRKR